MSKIDKDHFRGCLLGGGTGDARGYREREDGKDLISDNTQMSIFTADGLLWADARAKRKGIYAYTPCLFYSYEKWYYTQTGNLADKDYAFILDDDILKRDELFARRGEGTTSLNALGASIKNGYGTLDRRTNNMNTCGCVMRVAPVGLYFAHDEAMAFRIGCESGALTHGHEDAVLSTGFTALLICLLAQGATLRDAVEAALAQVAEHEDGKNVIDAVRLGMSLAEKSLAPRDAIETIGEGYTATEAVAIAVYLSLVYGGDFVGAIEAAADFDGNSDTIPPLCGNIIGTLIGSLEIPPKWILDLELADLVIDSADRLLVCAKERAENGV
ncbi:MAG: ADP-ribosylglycohydrolase family protein [Clostridiales Family XIII bacterium]|jgi:ADP-ribosylglycohydrolase|nr:ADP-ribosylglycohydrolase family protein [Clostridiales Family XIII bacterium]